LLNLQSELVATNCSVNDVVVHFVDPFDAEHDSVAVGGEAVERVVIIIIIIIIIFFLTEHQYRGIHSRGSEMRGSGS
jgi:hypothetical protein